MAAPRRRKRTKSNICAQRRNIEREAERLKKERERLEAREAKAREKAEAKAAKLRERHAKEAQKLAEKHQRELSRLERETKCPPATPRKKRTAKKKAAKKRSTKKKADGDGSRPERPAAASSGPSLTEALAAVGIRHEPGGRGLYRHRYFNAAGEHLGDLNASEGWAALKLGMLDRGQLTEAELEYLSDYVAGIAEGPPPTRPPPTKPAEAVTRTISPDDIDRQLATRAYAGTSWTPERRAEQERAAYVAFMEKLRGEVLEAGGDLDDFESFRAAWLKRKREQLTRRQGLVSSMIAGPAKFPVAQQRKRSDIYDRKQREFADWTDKQRRRLLGIGRSTAIRSTDDDAIERLQEKIEATEAHREVAKKANAILCKKRLSDAQKRAALAELGLSESTIKTRLRFGPFIMANISSEARRIKQRIDQLRELAEDKARGRFEPYERGPWTVTWDDDDGRVRVEGPKPPTREATRAQSAKFKARGFRWSPRNQAYQRQATENAWYAARSIVDALATVAQDAAA